MKPKVPHSGERPAPEAEPGAETPTAQISRPYDPSERANLWRRLRVALQPRNLELRALNLLDKRRGLDFLNVIFSEDVGLDSSQAFHSAASGNRWLRAALRELDIGPQHSILDVGCGKGSAMRVMLELPFRRVDGIELSPEIAAIARSNFHKLAVAPTRLQIFCDDARTFSALDGYTHLYFFNPFPGHILRDFMGQVEASLQRQPRELTVIYKNPVYHQDLVDCCALRKTHEFVSDWNHGISVYQMGEASSGSSKRTS